MRTRRPRPRLVMWLACRVQPIHRVYLRHADSDYPVAAFPSRQQAIDYIRTARHQRRDYHLTADSL